MSAELVRESGSYKQYDTYQEIQMGQKAEFEPNAESLMILSQMSVIPKNVQSAAEQQYFEILSGFDFSLHQNDGYPEKSCCECQIDLNH